MEVMTVENVLEITIDMLNKISVPVSMMDEIGKPIYNAVGNLKACVESIQHAEAEEKAKEEEAKEEEDKEEKTGEPGEATDE